MTFNNAQQFQNNSKNSIKHSGNTMICRKSLILVWVLGWFLVMFGLKILKNILVLIQCYYAQQFQKTLKKTRKYCRILYKVTNVCILANITIAGPKITIRYNYFIMKYYLSTKISLNLKKNVFFNFSKFALSRVGTGNCCIDYIMHSSY